MSKKTLRWSERADVDAARGEPLELDRRAAGEDREDDGDVGPALLSHRRARRNRPLHLARVVDDGGPPRGRGGRWRGRDRVHEEEPASPAARRGGARARRGRRAGRRRSRRPRSRLAAGRLRAARTGPAHAAASSRMPVLPGQLESLALRRVERRRNRGSAGGRRRPCRSRRGRAARSGSRASWSPRSIS